VSFYRQTSVLKSRATGQGRWLAWAGGRIYTGIGAAVLATLRDGHCDGRAVADLDGLVDDMTKGAVAAAPELASDAALEESVRASVRAMTMRWVDAERRRPGRPVPVDVPPAAIDVARDLIRHGVPAPADRLPVRRERRVSAMATRGGRCGLPRKSPSLPTSVSVRSTTGSTVLWSSSADHEQGLLEKTARLVALGGALRPPPIVPATAMTTWVWLSSDHRIDVQLVREAIAEAPSGVMGAAGSPRHTWPDSAEHTEKQWPHGGWPSEILGVFPRRGSLRFRRTRRSSGTTWRRPGAPASSKAWPRRRWPPG
jgi:hypothetical protein